MILCVGYLINKVMKTSKLFFLMMIAFAFFACSDDNSKNVDFGIGGTDENLPDAYASFSFKIPANTNFRSGVSRAETDAGSDAENIVTKLHVFIYDALAPHMPTVAEFNTADGSLTKKPGSTSEWVTAKAIKVKKSDKYIFVGVNLNQSIVDYIYNLGFGAFNYNELAQSVAALSDGINGFVMLNTQYPSITSAASFYNTEAEAQAAHLPINVTRTVAKAAVFKGPAFVVHGGGTLTNLSFGWRNLNNKFYLVQKVDGGLIKDYNWDRFTNSDFTRGTDELAVNENGVVPTVFSYATENAFSYVRDNAQVDQATFVSVSGTFTPEKILQLKAGVDNPTTAADFETVDNPGTAGTTFYAVRTDDGKVNCFATDDLATTYATLAINKAAGMPPLTGPYDVGENTYTNGKCYYHIFVNANAVSPQAPYNIYRNQYYKITLNSIQALGYPSDNFDDGQLIRENVWIGADIEINPWEVVESDEDL